MTTDIQVVRKEPDLELVAAIKRLLQLVETGEVRNVAYVTEHHTNDSSTYFNRATQTLIGANAILQRRMIKEFD